MDVSPPPGYRARSQMPGILGLRVYEVIVLGGISENYSSWPEPGILLSHKLLSSQTSDLVWKFFFDSAISK